MSNLTFFFSKQKRLLFSELIVSSLISLKIGFLSSLIIYHLFKDSPSIKNLIGGSISFSVTGAKSQDYAAALTFMIITILIFILTIKFLLWLSRRLPKSQFIDFTNAAILANLPFIYYVGSLHLYGRKLQLHYLISSFIAELFLLFCLSLILRQDSKYFGLSNSSKSTLLNKNTILFKPALSVFFFMVVAGLVTPSAFFTFIMIKKNNLFGLQEIKEVIKVGGAVATLLSFVFATWCFTATDKYTITRRLQFTSIGFQSLIILSSVQLTQVLMIENGLVKIHLEFSSIGILILGLVVLASISHLLYMAVITLRPLDNPNRFSDFKLLTPFLPCLIVFYLTTNRHFPGDNLLDDYHFGEKVLPYWALKNWGLIPYIDLSPAKGWIMLAEGFIAEEILGGTTNGYLFSKPFLILSMLMVLFVVAKPLIGSWYAFLLICMAKIGSTGIEIWTTALLIVLIFTYLKATSFLFLVIWGFLAIFGILMVPGYMGLLILATVPLCLISAYCCLNTQPKIFIMRSLAVIICFVLLFLTPVGEAVWGAFRYGMEQSSINTDAHSIAFSNSTENILNEIKRFGWIPLTVIITIWTLLSFGRFTTSLDKNRLFAVSVPIILLGFFLIIRSGGRIDVMGLSRPGSATEWYIGLLIPLIIFTMKKKQLPAVAIILIVACSSIMSKHISFDRVFSTHLPLISSNNVVKGADYGLPNLGRTIYPLERLEKYAALKHHVDSVLKPGEPIFNLTSRNLLTYLIDRPPFEESSTYNLVSNGQQRRTIDKIKKNPPNLILASYKNITHDGGPPGLRSPAVYREIVLNYIPYTNANAIWMVPKIIDEMYSFNLYEERMKLLDEVFFQKDLGYLPKNFGASWKEIKKHTQGHIDVDLEEKVLHHVELVNSYLLTSTGLDPNFTIKLKSQPQTIDYGLLIFDFHCKKSDNVSMQIYWSTNRSPQISENKSFIFRAGNGRIVIPLDSHPRWLLGDKATNLRFDLNDVKACGNWGISNAFLTQRIAPY